MFTNTFSYLVLQDEMTIAKEEIFGPVISILKFKYGLVFLVFNYFLY